MDYDYNTPVKEKRKSSQGSTDHLPACLTPNFSNDSAKESGRIRFEKKYYTPLKNKNSVDEYIAKALHGTIQSKERKRLTAIRAILAKRDDEEKANLQTPFNNLSEQSIGIQSQSTLALDKSNLTTLQNLNERLHPKNYAKGTVKHVTILNRLKREEMERRYPFIQTDYNLTTPQKYTVQMFEEIQNQIHNVSTSRDRSNTSVTKKADTQIEWQSGETQLPPMKTKREKQMELINQKKRYLNKSNVIKINIKPKSKNRGSDLRANTKISRLEPVNPVFLKAIEKIGKRSMVSDYIYTPIKTPVSKTPLRRHNMNIFGAPVVMKTEEKWRQKISSNSPKAKILPQITTPLQ